MGDVKDTLIEGLLLRQQSESVLGGIERDASYLETLLNSLESPVLAATRDFGEDQLAYLRQGFEEEVDRYLIDLRREAADAGPKENVFQRASKMAASRHEPVRESGISLLGIMLKWAYLGEDYRNLGIYRSAFAGGLNEQSPRIFELSFRGMIGALQWNLLQENFQPEPYQGLVALATNVYDKHNKMSSTSSMDEREKTIHRILNDNVHGLVSQANVFEKQGALLRLEKLFGKELLDDYDILRPLRAVS